MIVYRHRQSFLGGVLTNYIDPMSLIFAGTGIPEVPQLTLPMESFHEWRQAELDAIRADAHTAWSGDDLNVFCWLCYKITSQSIIFIAACRLG